MSSASGPVDNSFPVQQCRAHYKSREAAKGRSGYKLCTEHGCQLDLFLILRKSSLLHLILHSLSFLSFPTHQGWGSNPGPLTLSTPQPTSSFKAEFPLQLILYYTLNVHRDQSRIIFLLYISYNKWYGMKKENRHK